MIPSDDEVVRRERSISLENLYFILSTFEDRRSLRVGTGCDNGRQRKEYGDAGSRLHLNALR